MIRDPELRSAVERAYAAWQGRQEQLTLDVCRGEETGATPGDEAAPSPASPFVPTPRTEVVA